MLVLPGISAPDPRGAVLMTAAGVAWGVYSHLGRGVADPAATTARNFALATPPAALVLVAFAGRTHLDAYGAAIALVSGAVTSGLGYVAWYAALRGLTATSASIVQLAVPILAALGDVALLDERPSARLGVAAALTLGGIALATVRAAAGRAGSPPAAPAPPARATRWRRRARALRAPRRRGGSGVSGAATSRGDPVAGRRDPDRRRDRVDHLFSLADSCVRRNGLAGGRTAVELQDGAGSSTIGSCTAFRTTS